MSSLFDTIGPIILLACLGIGALVFACSGALRLIQGAKTDAAQRKLTEEVLETNRRSQIIIRDLMVAIDSDPLLENEVPNELQKRIWELHERFSTSQTKELSKW